LAARGAGRTEADIQSDVRMLLLLGLELSEAGFTVLLEAQIGDRRRIDVEAGLAIIEVKRDLRSTRAVETALVQLAGYVEERTAQRGQRYLGVLTDGADWQLYRIAGEALVESSSFTLEANLDSLERLCVWLESVFATREHITPSPAEVVRRLGAQSPGHALDRADLAALYEMHRDEPTVELKRELWAKLLTTALGTNFDDSDDLFLEHTLLVAMAEVIAHAVLGINPEEIAPAALLSGESFRQAGVGGVVDEDFFDWLVEVPGGEALVRSLARRLSQFDWGAVEHDVMKVLYESVISAEQRHRLGEYYTPDWLADRIVDEVVTRPLQDRVLDPACGSGTFLFHAVRLALQQAGEAGLSPAESISSVTSRIIGLDVHPVAVTFARVTYLLALGRDLIRNPNRGSFTVPVYLGDSLQWSNRREGLLTLDSLTIETDDELTLVPGELRFPDRLLADAGGFDRFVSELAERAAQRNPGSSPPSLAALYQRHAITESERSMLDETFATMCRLHDEGRDHIWSYYVRNLARPIWLAREDNRVDCLIGNPPWLAFRYMTMRMQSAFRDMSTQRNLWTGGKVSTNQDLSDLFVARSVELYLRESGRFGFVMPFGVLSRRQYAGFRTGRLATTEALDSGQLAVAFTTPWDLHRVKPTFFPVPACVVFGSRAVESSPLTSDAEEWSGRLPRGNIAWAEAAPRLSRESGGIRVARDAPSSPYAQRFIQGATLVPRVLLVVEDAPAGPLGVGSGRRLVRSKRSSQEKRPWKDVPTLEGVVESIFVRPAFFGSTILPFRLLLPELAVIPWDGTRLLDSDDVRLDLYPDFARWWRSAERIWKQHRSSERLNLLARLDFQRGLRQQLPVMPLRIAYGASGQYLAAAIVEDDQAVIEHKLYWATIASRDEGHYLCAILNSPATTLAVRPLQSRGEHNPRDFDKYIWQLPIPTYDALDPLHQHLTQLGERAGQVAGAVELRDTRFESQRRQIREALSAQGIARPLDEAVMALLQAAMP
jgi:hypothetical protein